MEFAIDNYLDFLSDLRASGETLSDEANRGDAFYLIKNRLVPYKLGKKKVHFVTYITTDNSGEALVSSDGACHFISSDIPHGCPMLEDLCILSSSTVLRKYVDESTIHRYIKSSDCYPTGVTLCPDGKLCVLSRVRFSHLVAHRPDFTLLNSTWVDYRDLTIRSNLDTIVQSSINHII